MLITQPSATHVMRQGCLSHYTQNDHAKHIHRQLRPGRTVDRPDQQPGTQRPGPDHRPSAKSRLAKSLPASLEVRGSAHPSNSPQVTDRTARTVSRSYGKIIRRQNAQPTRTAQLEHLHEDMGAQQAIPAPKWICATGGSPARNLALDRSTNCQILRYRLGGRPVPARKDLPRSAMSLDFLR